MKNGANFVIIVVYVDDLNLIGTHEELQEAVYVHRLIISERSVDCHMTMKILQLYCMKIMQLV